MHAINWFDIPALDFERAQKFYNEIFQIELVPMEGEDNYAMFPTKEGEIGGGLGIMDTKPQTEAGVLLYLNGGDDLSTVLDRVEGAGGSVVMPKSSIEPHGYIARFKDTEGNIIGLHSLN